MTYTIGEMAKRLGVPPSTLRYYDKEGLLPFVERTEGGRRVFKDSDYEWLKMIECLKKTGMQLKDIRKFVLMALEGDATIQPRLELIKAQRTAVNEKIAELQEILSTLEFKCWYYETALEQGSTEALLAMRLEEFPVQFRDIRKKLKGV